MLADGPVLATARVSRIDIAPQSFRTSSYCFAARTRGGDKIARTIQYCVYALPGRHHQQTTPPLEALL
jgi:hypothetical protein